MPKKRVTKKPAIRHVIDRGKKAKRIEELLAGAVKAGQYAMAIAYVEDGELKLHFETQRFPIGDQIPFARYVHGQCYGEGSVAAGDE